MARTIGLSFPRAEPDKQQEGAMCPHCGKEYKTPAALKAHVTKEHPQVFDEADKA